MFQALRVPDFRLLWAGGLVSSLGSWLLVLAVPAHILAVTGSLRDTGLAFAAQYLPQLVLGPVAGAVADAWDRRRLMIWANAGGAGAVAVMLLGTGPGRFWVLYAALAAESTAAVCYAPAWQARVPAVVGTGPLLASANSLSAASAGVVRLAGGSLGGFLLGACGIRWLVCADAVSYLVAAAAGAATSRSGGPGESRGASRSGVARDLVAGLLVLHGQPAARALLPVMVIFLTANAALSAVLIPFGIMRLGGSEHTGLLLSCLGAGFLLGAPVIRAVLDRAGTRVLLAVSLTATAAGYVLLFTSSSLASALPATVAVGMSGSMTLVTAQTALQRVIPGAALGRVTAVFLTAEAAATLAGSVAGPFLAQAAGLAAVAVAASLATLGAAGLAGSARVGRPDYIARRTRIQPPGRRGSGGRSLPLALLSSRTRQSAPGRPPSGRTCSAPSRRCRSARRPSTSRSSSSTSPSTGCRAAVAAVASVAVGGDRRERRRAGRVRGVAYRRVAVRTRPAPPGGGRRARRDELRAGGGADRRVRRAAVAAVARRPAGTARRRLRQRGRHRRGSRRGDRGGHRGAGARLGGSRGAGRDGGEHGVGPVGLDPAYRGLDPQHPSSLVYAINVPHHAPILLGAMYIMGDQQNGPQVGGGLTRWHSHLVTCAGAQRTIAGFGVQLRGGCDPATWQDRYTSQMLHVWVVPYPGGVFSDDLSAAATSSAVAAVLAGHSAQP